MKYSSGTTALATVSDTAVAAFTGTLPSNLFSRIRVINEGSVAGFFSIDGGTTWNRLPAASIIEDTAQDLNPGGGTFGASQVKIKRVASGSDLASVFVSID